MHELAISEGHQRARIGPNEWISLTTTSGKVLAIKAESLGVFSVLAQTAVRMGPYTKSKVIGELQVGDTVEGIEEKEIDGETRVRIKTAQTGNDEAPMQAWCTRATASGEELLEVDSFADAKPWIAVHENTVFDEPLQFKILASCTVRMGPEKDDKKVGEHSKGTVIDVVQEVTNWKGITTYQTVTPAKGQLMGGWVKLETSKGKVLLERFKPEEDSEEDVIANNPLNSPSASPVRAAGSDEEDDSEDEEAPADAAPRYRVLSEVSSHTLCRCL